MFENIDKNALFLIQKIQECGFEANIVGGCVRDTLLHRNVHDWDICTNATPEEVMGVFKNYQVLPTGLKHGTITVMLDRQPYEITTYRSDSEYEGARRPKQVSFLKNIEGDLQRRDFTINAMAYNPADGVIDLHGGQKDIQAKLIRCVGDSYQRFSEDALRILRAVRFASQLGFSIEEKTKRAMLVLKNNLQLISKERIQVELVKTLAGKYAAKSLMENKQILTEVIWEIKPAIGCMQNNKYHFADVYGHTLSTIEHAHKNGYTDISLLLALLLHDIGKPQTKTTDADGFDHFYGHAKKSEEIAKTILARLRFSNRAQQEVLTLIAYHDVTFEPSKKTVKRLLNKLGDEMLDKLILMRECDLGGYTNKSQDSFKKMQKFKSILEEIRKEGECFSVKMLKLNGNDLLSLGYKPGPKFKEILNSVLDKVLSESIKNDKRALTEYVLANFEPDKRM